MTRKQWDDGLQQALHDAASLVHRSLSSVESSLVRAAYLRGAGPRPLGPPPPPIEWEADGERFTIEADRHETDFTWDEVGAGGDHNGLSIPHDHLDEVVRYLQTVQAWRRGE